MKIQYKIIVSFKNISEMFFKDFVCSAENDFNYSRSFFKFCIGIKY